MCDEGVGKSKDPTLPDVDAKLLLRDSSWKVEILFENRLQLKGCVGGPWGLLTMGPAGAWQSRREFQEIHEPPKHRQRFPAFV